MYSITDIKKDTIIQIDDVPYRVVEYAQKQMGRGGSIVNAKLKNLLDGTVLQKTFKGQDKIEPADINIVKVQFLYEGNGVYNFMDQESFEQLEVSEEVLGESTQFLKEGDIVKAHIFNGGVINIELPVKMPFEVVEAPEVVKGDTQSTVLKEVEIETGAKVSAPIFIKKGDIIIVDTRDCSYVERQKS